MSVIRRRVFFEGRVQGVGFRQTTSRLANSLNLRGFVRNLDDGRVEVLAEGDPDRLNRLISALLAIFPSNLSEVDHVEEAVPEALVGFAIRR